MKFAHSRLWEALVKAHKYSMYNIYSTVKTIPVYPVLMGLTSAFHSLQWANFILKTFSVKDCMLRALGGAHKDPYVNLCLYICIVLYSTYYWG
jgi:hypothetical protein